MIRFDIDSWRAWTPEHACTDDWARWSRAPWVPKDDGSQPDVSFLPAMQRRRLSRLARMVFHTAWPLAEGQPPLPLIYVSRHGETSRTFAILSDLAQGEPLSPTRFSLSVHNAIIGLWSILRADTSEMTALACEGDGLQYGALEAAALLDEGAPAALLVVAEEYPEPVFREWITEVPCSYATAFLLRKGSTWSLSRDEVASDHNGTAQWPHALNLIKTLAGPYDLCENPSDKHLWTWRRS
jgi:hypothetical protein